jgi:hypothetical protein
MGKKEKKSEKEPKSSGEKKKIKKSSSVTEVGAGDAVATYLSPIAKPLAGKKQVKHLFRLAKKGMLLRDEVGKLLCTLRSN